MAYDILLGQTSRNWSTGSLLIPDKQQRTFLAKIDDVRYDVRRAGAKIGGATLVLSAALGLLAVASLCKTFKMESREPARSPYKRYHHEPQLG